MEIKLLGPVGGISLDITPKAQAEIMSSLPSDNKILDSNYDWARPSVQNSDCSKPANIIFSWALVGSLAEVTDIHLYISSLSSFEDAEQIDIQPGQMFLSLNNFIYDRYYWKMTAFSDDEILYETQPECFVINSNSLRWFDLHGITNVRDIGGIPLNDIGYTKRRMLYRGSELNGMLTARPSALKFLSNTMKIKTDLDLRRTEDIKDRISPIKNAELINVPARAYADIFGSGEREKYGNIFKILANESAYPIYLHCIAGADRTGTVIYILLNLLGADTETADYEYELTSTSVFGMRSRYNHYFYDFKVAFEQYGSTPQQRAENFLLTCAVSREEMQKIRTILTKEIIK